jgi:tetratricopeptide (TPR) repeat protein
VRKTTGLGMSAEARFNDFFGTTSKRSFRQTGKAKLSASLWLAALPLLAMAQDPPLDAAKFAYEKGDYKRAIEILKPAAEKDQGNGEIHLLLTKCYLETKHWDAAVSSGEKAVASNPKSSVYHQWLGDAYGQKADHVSMLSAYPLARKTQKEFETAVQLDEKNFDAALDLIEYDCTAPSIVGGGEDKAQALIQKLMSLDPAEGHYGAGICRAQKKDYAAADAEFAKALENKPKLVDRLYDIGDYFQQRGQADKVIAVADAGEAAAPNDPRGKFYRAVGWILQGEKLPEAGRLLKEYSDEAPARSTYPKPWEVHYWMGKLYEAQKNPAGAKAEYQAALKLEPKYKQAQDALKRLGG